MSNTRGMAERSRRQALRPGAGAGIGAVAGTLAAGGPAQAEGPVVAAKSTVTLAAAQMMIAAAMAKAQEIGVPMMIVVADEAGTIRASARMDGQNSAGAIDIVPRKAYTAGAFRAPTHVPAERFGADPARLASFANLPNVILPGGGFPITVDNAVVGAIAAGGGLARSGHGGRAGGPGRDHVDSARTVADRWGQPRPHRRLAGGSTLGGGAPCPSSAG